MAIKGLLLVWFIFICYSIIFEFAARVWAKCNRWRALREDYPIWLVIITFGYVIDFCYSIIYTLVWLCHM